MHDKDMNLTQTGFTEVCAQSLNADCDCADCDLDL